MSSITQEINNINSGKEDLKNTLIDQLDIDPNEFLTPAGKTKRLSEWSGVVTSASNSIKNLINAKQDKLVAGDGIYISADNIISSMDYSHFFIFVYKLNDDYTFADESLSLSIIESEFTAGREIKLVIIDATDGNFHSYSLESFDIHGATFTDHRQLADAYSTIRCFYIHENSRGELQIEYMEESLARISDLSSKQDTISDLATIRSGAAKGATALQSVKTINGYSLAGSGNVSVQPTITSWTSLDAASIKVHYGIYCPDNQQVSIFPEAEQILIGNPDRGTCACASQEGNCGIKLGTAEIHMSGYDSFGGSQKASITIGSEVILTGRDENHSSAKGSIVVGTCVTIESNMSKIAVDGVDVKIEAPDGHVYIGNEEAAALSNTYNGISIGTVACGNFGPVLKIKNRSPFEIWTQGIGTCFSIGRNLSGTGIEMKFGDSSYNLFRMAYNSNGQTLDVFLPYVGTVTLAAINFSRA